MKNPKSQTRPGGLIENPGVVIPSGNLQEPELEMKAVQELEAKRIEIETVCRQFGVARLRLFGSALRDDWNPNSSDYDFLAEFVDPPPGINRFHQLVDFILALEALMARRVDVVDWAAAKNPIFRKVADESAQLFYAA
jgi:predicted nucleotidyltransferase